MERDLDADRHEQVLTTTHVVDDGLPVLLVSRDEDGELQMHDGVRTPSVSAARVVCLHHLLDRDPGLRSVSELLRPGTTAVRRDPDAAWCVRRDEPPAPWRLVDALPGLAAALADLPLAARAAFALGVARRVVDEAAWPPLGALAEPLRTGLTGDTPARDRIGELVEAVDASDPAPDTEEFRRARAALAVWFALSDDPDEAANETAFEAFHFGLPGRDLVAAA